MFLSRLTIKSIDWQVNVKLGKSVSWMIFTTQCVVKMQAVTTLCLWKHDDNIFWDRCRASWECCISSLEYLIIHWVWLATGKCDASDPSEWTPQRNLVSHTAHAAANDTPIRNNHRRRNRGVGTLSPTFEAKGYRGYNEDDVQFSV